MDASTNTYVALAGDALDLTRTYGARSGGGLDLVFFYSNAWHEENLNSNTYVALAGDNQIAKTIYGARSGGGLDVTTFDGTDWVTEVISPVNTYTQLCSEIPTGNRLYGIRAGGGVDLIDKPAGSWVITPITSASYVAICSDFYPNTIYGARSGGGLDVLYYRGPTVMVGTNNKAVLDAIMTQAARNYIWVVWGEVSNWATDGFDLDDGSGVIIHVSDSSNSEADGNYVSVTGRLTVDLRTGPANIIAQRITHYSP